MGDGSGELAFVERLRSRFSSGPPGEHWIGDDAAVLDDGLLLKTDVLVEAVHFDLDWCSPEDVGWKALAVNLSDVAAMGGSPSACVVSLVVSADRPGFADRVMDGLAEASERFACPVVGGDTSVGPALVVAVAVLGRVPALGPVLRSGARAGDIIFVTGELGGAATALDAWRAGDTEPSGLVRLRRPTPRLAAGAAAAAAGATAMLDISDGLASDLDHLCRNRAAAPSSTSRPSLLRTVPISTRHSSEATTTSSCSPPRPRSWARSVTGSKRWPRRSGSSPNPALGSCCGVATVSGPCGAGGGSTRSHDP